MESGSLLRQVAVNQQPVCTFCDLHKQATTVCVPDRGSDSPLIYFVGEGPGKTEDKLGETFRGDAGELLDKFMQLAGLDPSLCRWGNVARCIPWENGIGGKTRPPKEHEIDACSQWLEPQILKADPIFIVPLGATAASYFLGEDTKISSVRGKRHIVELPTVRFRYQRLIKWLASKGVYDDKLVQVSSVGRQRAIDRATEQHGFKDIPTRQFTVFPTWHPAAVLYGNSEAEVGIVSDLNVLVGSLLGKEREGDYKIMTSVEEVVHQLRQLREEYRAGKFPYCSFDFEANSLEVFRPTTYITTMAFTPYREKAWIIPWDHRESPFKRDMMIQKAIQAEFNLTFAEVPVVGHNFKYDYELGYVRGFNFGKLYDDTELMSWTLFNDTQFHNLDYLTSKYTDLKSPKFEMKQAQSYLPKDERYDTDNHDLDLVGKYNGFDVDSVIRLAPVFEHMLVQDDLLTAHRYFAVGSFMPTVSMEINGTPIDQTVLGTLDSELTSEMNGYMKDLEEMGMVALVEDRINDPTKPAHKRKKFSVGSSEQVSLLLYDILTFKVEKRGKVRKKGKHAGKALPSADKHILQKMFEDSNDQVTRLQNNPDSGDYQLWRARLETLKIIMEFKRISKIHSSYVKNMPGHIHPHGYIHCDFGIRHTGSGRFNCTDPSLHVIPWHSSVKKMFVSRFINGLMLSADFSQMELRKFAMVTGDAQLIQAFIDKKDIHRMIAAKVGDCREEDVSDDDRRRIKTVVFGLLYGRGPKSIAAQEQISVEKAKEIIAGVFKQFPRVREFISQVHDFVNKHGYVRYINGFRRLLPVDPTDTSRAERQAVNTVIQGPASDMAVAGMINMYKAMKALRVHSKHWEFKHDDLAFDIAPGELLLMTLRCQMEMSDRPSRQFSYVNVPLKVDFECGVSWGQLVEMSIVDGSTLKFSGAESDINPLLERFMAWSDTPIVLDRSTKIKEKPAVIRSLMKTTGEKIKYNHDTLVVQFPPFVRREPGWQHPGLIIAA